MLAWSILAAVATLRLVDSQTTDAACKTGNEGRFNSLGQSPCLMAAYMMGACQPDGNWDIQALADITFMYRGPMAEEANVCTCSSIAYMLSSAFGEVWIQNCSPQDVNKGSWTRLTSIKPLG
ncbi:hypothetical protein BD311DRAFT_773018 [Dichomitus squalens]|uniref:Cyanovirin-N domain-containing protein n=1 Tax=Dichomitus squalens TaxID=114155 RepID=A0A4Q9N7B4_9APHY|nr:hypothetical protein BD311DRAFT_773018 [Dichomitus squalens]